MKWNCFFTHYPITQELKGSLEKLCKARIPFNSVDTSLNTYIYLEPGIEIPSVYLQPSEYKFIGLVDMEKIDKHCGKSIEISKIKEQDIVLHKDFKELPLFVKSIENDKANIEVALRNYKSNFTLDCRELKTLSNHFEKDKKAVDYSVIPSFEFSRQENILIIDCDLYSSKSFELDYISMLKDCLRIKTLYQGYNVVLANPISDKFAKDFGLRVVYGDLQEYINSLWYKVEILLYTDKEWLQINPRIKALSKKSVMYEVTYKDVFESYGIYNCRAWNKQELDFLAGYMQYYFLHKNDTFFAPQGLPYVIRQLDTDISFIERNSHLLKELPEKLNTFVEFDFFDNLPTANIILADKMNELGFNYISQNIEFYSRIIKS